jgi:putative multiple sugar transport system substrate-binding protein
LKNYIIIREEFQKMKKKLLSAVLSVAVVASLLVGCGSDKGAAGSDGAASGGTKVGVSMPTKDLQRWNQDGSNMEAELKAAGYEVDLQFASNDVQTQVSQIENMISSGADVLVIAAIEGSSLGEALDMAKDANIPVIAYDRLLMNSDAVSYYATFDNYMVGQVQGQYVVDTLDLENAAGPFNLELTAGDPGDNNAGFFFNGAYDVLKPYIESGKLNVVSGQKTFDECATPTWATETAQSRAENILSSNYSDGTNVDVWLCSNDSTALGVENALAANYNGTYPIVTGQDCDIENVKNMIAGKQSMSVFKDTRTLASQVVKMVGQILKGETVDVNDTETYDNGTGVIPSYLCQPVFADVNNYKELLIDSGYYTEDQLK